MLPPARELRAPPPINRDPRDQIRTTLRHRMILRKDGSVVLDGHASDWQRAANAANDIRRRTGYPQIPYPGAYQP